MIVEDTDGNELQVGDTVIALANSDDGKFREIYSGHTYTIKAIVDDNWIKFKESDEAPWRDAGLFANQVRKI